MGVIVSMEPIAVAICCFFTFSVLVANPDKLLFYTMAIRARVLLKRKKITKRESLADLRSPFPPRCSFEENTIQIT